MTARDLPARDVDGSGDGRGKARAAVLKIRDVSKVLQVSVGQARELIGSGKIPKIPGLNPKTIRVSREALDAFIKTGANR